MSWTYWTTTLFPKMPQTESASLLRKRLLLSLGDIILRYSYQTSLLTHPNHDFVCCCCGDHICFSRFVVQFQSDRFRFSGLTVYVGTPVFNLSA